MDEIVKRRVVGAGVVALLGVILLPWLFGEPNDPRAQIRASFPGAPLPTPTPRTSPPSPPPADTAPPVAAAEPLPATPAASAAPAAEWVLQLASYRREQDAEAFLERLQKDGHNGYRESVVVNGQTYHRVRLRLPGPRAEALRTQKKLEQRYRLEAQLLSAR